MMYHIKPEYLTMWGEDCTEDTLIDTAEVEHLAAEWDKPIEELLPQLEATDLVELDGNIIHMETAAELMDDEIREQLHAEGITDPQTFLDRYCEEHYAKYGESFTV